MKLSDIGVTPIKEKQFATKGIFTVEDLVAYLPNRYNDYSQITGILPPESVSCFRATVDRIERKYGGKKPYLSGKVTTQDWSGYRSVFISWFNMNFLYNEFCSYIGQEVLIVGKVQERNGYLVMTNPEKFGADFDLGIYPVYPQINKMNAKYLSDTIRSSITVVENHCEMLPSDVVKKYNLLPMSRALHFIHEPKDMGETVIGKQRSIINDLIYFSVHNTLNHADSFIKSKYAVTSLKLMNAIYRDLPFSLTEDQKTVIRNLTTRAQKGKRIDALVQGDVGCGKTIVSALIAATLVGSGYQAVIMAPTKVLAKQHYDGMKALFEPHGIQLAFLYSGMKKKEQSRELEKIASGEAQLIIGTHSCVADTVNYKNLAIAIVDEEHKFGVAQRAKIVAKAEQGIHKISMSATPIPRSLAQVIYGDAVQLEVIRSMPSGRKPVITGIAEDQRKILRFILKEVRAGHQGYIVCPMIAQNEVLEGVTSVEEISAFYNHYLAKYGVRIATLTGKDKKEATEKTIESFKNRDIDILISTTVIEVGVNVPNATFMLITSADRFGLSGMHQLRGRVGRGELQSYCLLQSSNMSPKTKARLEAMCSTTNGFDIAEIDLKLRGAGDLLGVQQSGFDNKYMTEVVDYPDEYALAKEIALELIHRGDSCCKLMKRITSERTAPVEALKKGGRKKKENDGNEKAGKTAENTAS